MEIKIDTEEPEIIIQLNNEKSYGDFYYFFYFLEDRDYTFLSDYLKESFELWLDYVTKEVPTFLFVFDISDEYSGAIYHQLNGNAYELRFVYNKEIPGATFDFSTNLLMESDNISIDGWNPGSVNSPETVEIIEISQLKAIIQEKILELDQHKF